MNMRLIPDGVPRTGRGEKTIRLPSFYMGETKVTVHHFVDFLNSVRHELTVENGVVRRGSETWLLLETGGQIVYRHSRFHIPDLKNAAQPVVRVTWYGASAFARYFDKDVPTADEWKYAAQTGDLLPGAPNKFDLKDMGGEHKGMGSASEG